MRYIVFENSTKERIDRTVILAHNIVSIDEYEDKKKEHFDIRLNLVNEKQIYRHFNTREAMEETFNRILEIIEE